MHSTDPTPSIFPSPLIRFSFITSVNFHVILRPNCRRNQGKAPCPTPLLGEIISNKNSCWQVLLQFQPYATTNYLSCTGQNTFYGLLSGGLIGALIFEKILKESSCFAFFDVSWSFQASHSPVCDVQLPGRSLLCLLDELMQEHPALSYLVRSVPGMPNGLPSSKARLALASKNWHQFRHNIPYIYL